MPDARINGARIWYKETGEGDPVIQIHGAGFGHFNFATATPILSQTFRCIDFDMRGYGQSERPLQRYDMEVWADDAARLMDHLGLGSAHIHGTSMGGMVAQQFAAKYPERTQRLVINCSAAKLDYAGVLTFRGWIEIAERLGVGSRTLAELIALQALSRRFLDSPKGPGAVDMIQDVLRNSNRV
jgi:3-oxoadipate enol-lactonase